MKTTNFIGPQARCGAINNKGRVAREAVVLRDGPELFYGSTRVDLQHGSGRYIEVYGFGLLTRGDSGLRLSPSEGATY